MSGRMMAFVSLVYVTARGTWSPSSSGTHATTKLRTTRLSGERSAHVIEGSPAPAAVLVLDEEPVEDADRIGDIGRAVVVAVAAEKP